MKKQFRLFYFFSLVLFLSSALKAQDNASWYKKWKDPSNSDSVRLSGLELLTFSIAYSDPDSAIKLAEFEKSEAIKYRLYMYHASAFYNIGIAYKTKGNSVKGIENARLALKEFEALKDSGKMANTHNLMGSLFDEQGNLDKCLEEYYKSISIKDKIKDEAGLANSYNNLGILFNRIGNVNKAIEYYEKCIVLRKKNNEKMGLAKALSNLGGVFVDKKEFDKALNLYRTSLDIRIKAGKLKSTMVIYLNFGETYFLMKQIDSSKYYFDKYYKMALKENDNDAQAQALLSLGNVALNENKFAEAELLLNKADKMTKMRNKLSLNLEINKTFYDLYEKMKNPALALKHHLLYIAIKDSLFNEEQNGNIIKQQMRFDFEQKEAETREIQARKDGEIASVMASQKKIILISVSAAILVLILLIFSVLAFRKSQSANIKIEKQNIEILNQKHIVDEKQKEILDSIHYAKRIQNALITSEKYIERKLNELNNL